MQTRSGGLRAPRAHGDSMVIRPMGVRPASQQVHFKSQFVPLVRDAETGDMIPENHCLLRVFCMTDGSFRIWRDDGVNKDGTPNVMRQQILRWLKKEDEDGDPIFVVEEKLTAWKAGNGRVFQPVSMRLLDDRLAKKSQVYQDARAKFLSGAPQKVGVVQNKVQTSFDVIDKQPDAVKNRQQRMPT